MIQAPINVTPNNETIFIDKTMVDGEYTNAPVFSFTFNGDGLSFYKCEFYNNRTGLKICNFTAPNPEKETPWTDVKNGHNCSVHMGTIAREGENGKDYKYRYILYQVDSNLNPLCDMKVMSARVQADSSGTTIALEDYLDNIVAPYMVTDVEDVTHTIGLCKVIFNSLDDDGNYTVENTIGISSYDKTTGIVTLQNSFNGTIEKNQRVEIWCNYLKTPMYFFKARNEATITPSVIKNANFNSLECSSGWSASSSYGISLQSYQWEIYNSSTKNDTTLVCKSPEIYSYHKLYSFPSHETTNMNYDFPILANQSYYVNCISKTQDNVVTINEVTMNSKVNIFTSATGVYTFANSGSYTNGLTISQASKCVYIKLDTIQQTKDRANIAIYRKSSTDTEYRLVAFETTTTDNNLDGTTLTFRDYLVTAGVEYTYLVTQQYVDDTHSTTSKAYIMGSVTPSWCGYSLQAIQKRGSIWYGMNVYGLKKTANLYFDLTPPTNTTNQNILVHEGGNAMPQVSRLSGRYRNGSLNGSLANIEMVNSVSDITDWNEMLKNYNLFLLKTPVDETMVVSITNGGEISHSGDDMFTMFSLDYVEVMDIKDIFVV